MERGDIAEYSILGQSCIWEGVLATPPEGITAKTKYKFYERANNCPTFKGNGGKYLFVYPVFKKHNH